MQARIWFTRFVRTTGIFRRCLALAILLAPATAALGQTAVWTGAVGSDWSVSANWQGNAAPGDGDTVVFDFNTPGFSSYTSTNNLSGLSLAGITFNEQSLPNNFNVTGNGVTLGAGGITSQVLGSATLSLGGTGITLAADAALTNNNGLFNLDGAGVGLGAHTLSFSGISTTNVGAPISGTGGIHMLGPGTANLGGANSYTGLTRITGGVLRLVANDTLPTGTTVTMSAGLGMDAETWRAIMTPDGARVFLGQSMNEGQFWTVPQPRRPVPPWFPDFLETLAGMKEDHPGHVRLSPARQAADTLPKQSDSPYATWARGVLR